MSTRSEPTRLFLTGYRGTGKSTVARLLAQRLTWDCVDSDDVIEERIGTTIAQVFAEEGEPAFRDLEEQVVAELCGREHCVIALGGGAILRDSTRLRLHEAGPVVWLTASPATLAERLAADDATATRRPNLTASGGWEEIERLLAQRTPMYRAAADLELSTESATPMEMAESIAAWMATP